MMKQVAFRLEEDVIKQAKVRALEENTTFQALMMKALEQYLAPKSSLNQKQIAKTLHQVLKHTGEIQKLLGADPNNLPILTKI